MLKKSILFTLILPAVIAGLGYFPVFNQKDRFHTEEELAFFAARRQMVVSHGEDTGPLVIDSSILFPTAKLCGGCHGHDPNGLAFITPSGEDVNIYDDWRTTMMAMSAKDPFWRAKVRHESLVNPAHAEVLQDKCTSCHAPGGHYQAKLKEGLPYYTLAHLYADTLGLDGVNCQACHAQSPASAIGSQHSGTLLFDTDAIRVAYGPYQSIFAAPMQQFVGITPKYGEHIFDSGICAGCHSLITQSVDLAGNPTGTTFIEQATYHEWLNSRYDEEHDNIACQSCHLEDIPDAVVIAANYQFLTPKWPFSKHELVGANTAMLELMKQNRQALDLSGQPEHFDSTIAATLRMLQNRTLRVQLRTLRQYGDTLDFQLKLENLAGHKFPSGYPSRRAWIEFEVSTQSGTVLFHSGAMAADYSIPEEDVPFEPHYPAISRPDQVQIYEQVTGDVNGNFTNVLERAYIALKDNRLVPQGFSLSDPAYDTTMIVGGAVLDADFNRDSTGQQGTGADAVFYRIARQGYTGEIKVTARVWYQSLPPRWMQPLFDYSAPEIDTFKQMYYSTEAARPVLVAEQVLDGIMVGAVSTTTPNTAAGKIFPTLCRDGMVWIQPTPGTNVHRVQVWTSGGRLVSDSGDNPVRLPVTPGVYWIKAETSRGVITERVVRQ